MKFSKGEIISWVVVACSGAISAIASQVLSNYITDRNCKIEEEEKLEVR